MITLYDGLVLLSLAVTVTLSITSIVLFVKHDSRLEIIEKAIWYMSWAFVALIVTAMLAGFLLL